jgi:hypothetical protein
MAPPEASIHTIRVCEVDRIDRAVGSRLTRMGFRRQTHRVAQSIAMLVAVHVSPKRGEAGVLWALGMKHWSGIRALLRREGVLLRWGRCHLHQRRTFLQIPSARVCRG